MQFKDFEAWVWTELLAFDNTREDCGAAEYFAELGVRVLRYSNRDVNKRFRDVCEDILRETENKALT